MLLVGKVSVIGKCISTLLVKIEAYCESIECDDGLLDHEFSEGLKRLVRLMTSDGNEGYGVWNAFLCRFDYTHFYS